MRKSLARRSALVLVAAGMAALPALAAAEEVIAVTTDNRLIKFDTATPGTVTSTVAITGVTGTIVAIDVRPSGRNVFAVTDGSLLYRINPVTGVATAVTAVPFAPALGTAVGMDFNPVVDRIRIVTDTNRNMRVNPNDGSLVDGDGSLAGTQEDAALAYALGDVNFAFDPSVVAAAYTNNDTTAVTTSLFGIDSAQDVLVAINPPNAGTLTTVGALGVNATDLTGFDISTATGTAFTTMTVFGGTQSNLYTVNLATGAVTLVGQVGDIVPIRAMTLGPANPPAAPASKQMISVNTAGELLRFDSATPGTITQRTPVTGLVVGDSLVALDTRPANGRLYGLGSAGRIYVINSVTGVAQAIRTAPFEVPLSGTEFGFDFNPAADRIRIVSDANQNLRIHPDTGGVVDGDAVTAGIQGDATLDYAAADVNDAADPDIVAVAYDRNDTTTATTLFGIDATLNILVRQGSADGTPESPNSGLLHTIGALGVDVTSVASFEIADVDTALASMTTAIGGPSRLFEINLITGVATLVGDIGVTETVRGLTENPTSQPPVISTDLVIKKLQINLDFKRSDRDKVILMGSLPVPAGSLEGKVLTVDVGGFTQSFTLDSRGRAHLDEGTRQHSDDDDFKFTGKPKNGRVDFKVLLLREDLSDELADEDMNGDETAKKADRTVRVTVTLDGTAYSVLVNLRYTAKPGKNGVAQDR